MNIAFSYILGYIFSILPIPELTLYGSRGMATEAGNSVRSGSKRIAPPKSGKDVPCRSWEK